MRRSTIIAVTLVVSAYALYAGPEVPEEAGRRGLAFYEKAQYAEAEHEHRKSVEHFRSLGPSGVVMYAASMNNLAAALQAQGKTTEARELMQKTIALERQLGPFCDPILTHALNNLALMHHVEAELLLAANLLKKALKTTPGDGITRAGTLHNLAAIYFDMGKRKQAEELFEQSLAMNVAAGGKESLPPTYTYLARLAANRKDIARAESLMLKALDIRREIAPNHPSLATTLGDIGELQKDTQRYDKAIENFKLALDLLDSVVGKDHLHSAPILFQHAETLCLLSRTEEALPLYERVIAILQRSFGAGHARLATVYESAAAASAKLKRKAEAKDYRQRASAILSQRVDYGRHTIDASAFLSQK
ncbi:MAG TPA: tetratricopeptide repeat protein [Bryobacteraceae bacterium]|nr:tetratricopeptide repeat protein [Bryobacteraceae bacterium]